MLTSAAVLTGKGNDSGPDGLIDMVTSGCAGLKLHEVRLTNRSLALLIKFQDWGSTPSAIDNCLTVCDEYDVQVSCATPVRLSRVIDAVYSATSIRTL